MIGAVVLAAGAATRFGSPKQRQLLPGVLDRLRQTSVAEIVVVAGAYELESAESVTIVRCDEWARGPGASLRCGLQALSTASEAAIVVLADGPNLAPEAVERVAGAWREGAGELVAASYDGERGHPLLVGRPLWGSVPDEGLRTMSPALVPCDDLGPPGDVDTQDDLMPQR